MRLAITRLHGEAERTLSACTEQGAFWTRFGGEVLLGASDRNWPAVAEAAGRGEGTVTPLDGRYPDRHLHLVVQKGRLFQQEQPDVPVLHDRGRYLVVALPPEEAARLDDDASCYFIVPLPRNQAVFEVRARAAGRAAVPWVQSLVDGVSRTAFEADLGHLTSFPTRHSTSAHFATAAAWARDRLVAMGYSVHLETVPVGGGTSHNVVAERRAAGTGARDLVLVVAHLDSVNSAGGPAAPAPGADDNASGSAGLLAVARALQSHPARHDLRLVLFGGEEQGLRGSRQYVGALSAADRGRLRAVINMDMIASQNTPDPTVLLEGAVVSQSVIDALADAAATYTGLTVQTSLSPYASDHVPFIDAGLPAVLTIEGADGSNPHIHSATDTVDRLEIDLAVEILRMNVAAVAQSLEQTGGALMPGINLGDFIGTPLGDLTVPDLVDSDMFIDLINKLRPGYSGRYPYNGGAGTREASSGRAPSTQVLTDPRYELDEPVYLDDLPGRMPPLGGPGPFGPLPGPQPFPRPDPIPQPIPRPEPIPRPVDPPLVLDPPIVFEPPPWWDLFRRLRFTLHIDIDGTNPLNVVSGSIVRGFQLLGVPAPHFIGRVTQNRALATGGGRELVVEDFTIGWPGTGVIIDRLEITVRAASFFATPEAEVTFVSTGSGRRYGPYAVSRASRYFRDVEIDVDREDGAAAVEPYDTHAHPDRPAGLPRRQLTLERTFGDAGIRVTRAPGSGSVIATSEAQADARWSNQELHDSMSLHWDAFANRPQWKMWVFLAEHHANSGLGGIMFDGNINEPGGVDRQGTAVFTQNEFFHKPTGGFASANPPEDEAAQRELFFNLIHETGHAFNLAHSWQKLSTNAESGSGPWTPPAWMPLANDDNALSWMNYSDRPSPGANATWFYDRFRFRFSDDELLFLRHAPGEFVQMGNADWFHNHGRVTRSSVDERLGLSVRLPKPSFAYGEPVFAELQLTNRSGDTVGVNPELDPADGFVEIAVTRPNGERVPLLPLAHMRCRLETHRLEAGGTLRHAVNLSVGKLGFTFKEPGAYRVEAAYTNHDGWRAAAVTQLYVEPPSTHEERRAVAALFDARVGRALYFGGSRVLEEANDRIDWAMDHLGERHPARYYLAAARYLPLGEAHKVVEPRAERVRVLDAEPDRVAERLAFVIHEADEASRSMSPLAFREVAEAYVRSAREAGDQEMVEEGRHAIQAHSGSTKSTNGRRQPARQH